MSREEGTNPLLIELAPEDGHAIDALIESRAMGPRLASSLARPPVEPDRAASAAWWMSLIDEWPADEAPDHLVRGTLQRLRRHHSTDLDVVRLRGHQRGLDMPVRMREIMAVAAMLIVGVSLALPILARTRHEAMRVACRAQLATVGKAFAQYAGDYLGTMPRRSVVPNSSWYHVGWTLSDSKPVRSNSANLYLLARYHYVEPSTLACPAKDRLDQVMTAEMRDWQTMADVSYSYHNQFAARASRLEREPHMAILADKNPRFVVHNGTNFAHLTALPESTASLTHHSRGQNVLFADGGVRWCTTSIMPNGDNIWLAEGVDVYKGTEIPSRDDDAFLVP